MVGILVYHEVISAVPTPVGAYRPVPWRDFEIKSAGQPKTVVVAVNPDDVVTVTRPKARKVPVLVRLLEVVALVLRLIVAIPMVMIHMLPAIHLSVFVPLFLHRGMSLTPIRRGRDFPLI